MLCIVRQELDYFQEEYLEMLPLLDLRHLTLQSTGAPEKRKAPDSALSDDEKQLSSWVEAGFVSVRPQNGGHTLKLRMHLTGTQRIHTNAKSQEPTQDKLKGIITRLQSEPMLVINQDPAQYYMQRLPDLVAQALEKRRKYVTKRLIEWMKNAEELNTFRIFQNKDDKQWCLEAFETALSPTNRAELLELLEDVLGFVRDPGVDPQSRFNKRWIRQEANDSLPEGVLEAFKFREAKLRDALEESKATEEKLKRHQEMRSSVASEAEQGARVRRAVEQAHTNKDQEKKRKRELMFNKAKIHGFAAVSKEDVAWHDSVFPTSFADYFNTTRKQEFEDDISKLYTRLPGMRAASVPLTSWQAAAFAHAILGTIANMCDSLVKQLKGLENDAGQLTAKVRYTMPLPPLSGKGVELFVRTQPSAPSGPIAWMITLLEKETTRTITNLDDLYNALNRLVLSVGGGTLSISPSVDGWTPEFDQATPRVQHKKVLSAPVKVDQRGWATPPQKRR